MSEGDVVPSDSEEEDRMFVAEVLEQIRRDERRSQIIRSLVIVCGLTLAWLCGAAWALWAVGGV